MVENSYKWLILALMVTSYMLLQTTTSTEGFVVPAHSREDVRRLFGCWPQELINSRVSMALGKQLIGTDEHSRWENDLYDLRNAVIHDGKEVRENEAERALEAAEDALVWIGVIMPKQLPTDDRLRQSSAYGQWSFLFATLRTIHVQMSTSYSLQ